MALADLTTPLASVDWCEPNYAHSPHVAEWWNTLSSLPIALAGLWGAVRALRGGYEPRFLLSYVAIFVVGLGSAAFHGTLLRIAQAADELPMIVTGLTFVYTVRWRASTAADRTTQRAWQATLCAYAAAFTATYFVLPSYFVLFITSYSALVAYLVVRTAILSFVVAPDPNRKRLFLVSAGSYVGGVLLLWVPEHLLLPCDHPLQRLQLHAIFHLTSAVGSFAWTLWALRDRALERARLPRRGEALSGSIPPPPAVSMGP